MFRQISKCNNFFLCFFFLGGGGSIDSIMIFNCSQYYNKIITISIKLQGNKWRHAGLMVSYSALVSGSSGLGLSPGQGHCVVFLGKTLYSHSASLHPGV